MSVTGGGNPRSDGRVEPAVGPATPSGVHTRENSPNNFELVAAQSRSCDRCSAPVGYILCEECESSELVQRTEELRKARAELGRLVKAITAFGWHDNRSAELIALAHKVLADERAAHHKAVVELSEVESRRVPRVWRRGDPEPPAEVTLLLVEPGAPNAAYLKRSGEAGWRFVLHPDDERGPAWGWCFAFDAEFVITLTEVLDVPAPAEHADDCQECERPGEISLSAYVRARALEPCWPSWQEGAVSR